MNHLPVPAERQRPARPVLLFGHYDIPFLGGLGEANDDFFAYPVQQKLVEEDGTYSPRLDDLHEEEDAEVWFTKLQAWLYFGLIRDTFGPTANPQHFVVINTSTGERIIDSTGLKKLTSQWRTRATKLPKPCKTTEVHRIRRTTTTSWKFCDQLDHCGLARNATQMLVVFSIRILISTIWDMLWASDIDIEELPGDDDIKNMNERFRLSTDVIQWPRLPASYRPLAVLMIEYGWCSHEILRLLGTYHLTTIWSMTCLLQRTPSTLDHGRCAEAIKCIARDVNPIEHQAEHLTGDCTCEAVGPEIEEVKAILRAGRRHIAFSHVWADGIVISRQNKIFTCQFLKLFAYLEKARAHVQAERLFFFPFAPFLARHVLKGPISFDIWLDIFCIPSVLHSDAEELRKKAIARIYPVFAGAEAVLVVDKALTQADSTNMPTTEVMARVASSGWMTRCWTFSEMSLAHKSIVLFCVGDSVVRYEDFHEYNKSFKLLDIPSRSCVRNLLRSAFYPFQIAWIASQAVVSEYVAFALVWNSLTARSTSWPEDIWGIMATLLGYSAKEIMTLQERERLPAMMKVLPKLPASFFFRNLPRSSSAPAPMRWIPTMVQGIIRDPDGTFAFAEGGILFPRSLKLKFLLTVTEAPPTTFSFELDGDSLPSPDVVKLVFEITLHDHNAVVQHVHHNAQVCILLPRNEAAAGDSATTYISGIGCALLATKVPRLQRPRSRLPVVAVLQILPGETALPLPSSHGPSTGLALLLPRTMVRSEIPAEEA